MYENHLLSDMSSKNPTETESNTSNLAETSTEPDGTVTCFWSSSDPDWYDDYVSDRA